MGNEKLAGLTDTLCKYATDLQGFDDVMANINRIRADVDIKAQERAANLDKLQAESNSIRKYTSDLLDSIKDAKTYKPPMPIDPPKPNYKGIGLTAGALALTGLGAYALHNREKKAGLNFSKVKGAFGTFKKNLGGRHAELESAHTNKVISEAMLDNLATKEREAVGALGAIKSKPSMFTTAEHAKTEARYNEIRNNVEYYTGERERLRGEIHDIHDSVFKARAGAGIAGGAALTAAGYSAKKYYDDSIQTELSDRDKVAMFNPAPWADDVINSYTQVNLVWEQKKRKAAEEAHRKSGK